MRDDDDGHPAACQRLCETGVTGNNRVARSSCDRANACRAGVCRRCRPPPAREGGAPAAKASPRPGRSRAVIRTAMRLRAKGHGEVEGARSVGASAARAARSEGACAEGVRAYSVATPMPRPPALPTQSHRSSPVRRGACRRCEVEIGRYNEIEIEE